VELAEEIFHMPVRVGKPQGVTGLMDIVRNPIYSTAVGLLLYGAKQQDKGKVVPTTSSVNGMMARVKNWLTGGGY
jgi:cell division protein FtsA